MTMPDDQLAYNRKLIEEFRTDGGQSALANPAVTVEVPGQSYPALASPLTGDDYHRQWAAIQAKYPFFSEHQERAGDRRIPVVALTKTG